MQSQAELITAIKESVIEISNYLESISQDQMQVSIDDKWSIAENIIHLNKSVAPINMALSLPKFSFIPFGKSKHHYSYEEIIDKYQAKLKEGVVATGPYIPSKRSKRISKNQLIKDFRCHYSTFTKKIDKWSEEALDKYRLPHPIIGKITIREMTFFTIYHVKHHFNTMNSGY